MDNAIKGGFPIDKDVLENQYAPLMDKAIDMELKNYDKPTDTFYEEEDKEKAKKDKEDKKIQDAIDKEEAALAAADPEVE